MKKSVLVLMLALSLLFAFTAFAANEAKESVQMHAKKSVPTEKPGRAELFRTQGIAEDAVIWSDDFEGGQATWQPDPHWTMSESPNAGRNFQPMTNWALVETNSASPTHSWNATETYDAALDLLISPIITLPEMVETAGVQSPLKGVKIAYNFDVDTPQNSQDNAMWEIVFGRVEAYWHVSADHVAAGTNAFYLDNGEGSTDGIGRQWLLSPAIDLTSATGTVTLTFKHDWETEAEWDYHVLEVTTDGWQTFTYIAHWGEDGASGGFVDESFDLSAFIGQTIQVRFESSTDEASRVGFWAIDEIKIADGNGDIFYDGAEGEPLMTADGFVSVATPFGGLYAGGQATPTWYSRLVDVPAFKEVFFPGDEIRVAFRWYADGDDTMGRGFFLDDVQVLGIGIPEKDLAISGLTGLNTIALNKAFAPVLKATNTGLNPVSGTVAWQGSIKDSEGNPVHVMVGTPQKITDLPVGESIEMPVLTGRHWTPTVPGVYEMGVQLNFADGDAENNVATVELMVPGGMFSTTLLHETFATNLGQTSFEDFGWTVVNGGGNEILGTNNNTWELFGLINPYGAIISWGWGNLDLGLDMDAVNDSSEVLEEYLITPPIDVTGLNAQNTLAVRYYTYYRPSYPGYSPPMGTQKNAFTVDWTVDGGETWVNAFEFAQDDSAYSGSLDRLPHMAYGGDPLVTNYLAYMNHDLTPALHAAKKEGTNTVWVRFGLYSEDSYIMGASVEDVMVYAGMNAPVITELEDVPQDNGKMLHLTFAGSVNDLVYEWENFDLSNPSYTDVGDVVAYPVTHYNVWRVNEPALGASYSGVFADMKSLVKNVKQPVAGDFYYLEGDATVVDFVATIPAMAFPRMGFSYGYAVPTLWDEMPTAVIVTAHTPMSDVFAFSQPAAAMSEDNLAPAAPAGLGVSTAGNTNVLVWEAAYTPVDDVKFYTVYRSEQSGTYGAALATTADLNYTDTSVEIGKTYYYVVSATDFAGNESAKSGEGNVITSVASDKAGVPTEFALNQNYPNPFNPTTTVEYALPQASEVVVSIFNTNGQLIQTINAGYQDAGYHKVTWDASSASAGLYFLQFKAGNFSKMIKMTLLK